MNAAEVCLWVAALLIGTGLNACTLVLDKVVAATNPNVDQMAVLVNFIVVSVSCVCLSKKRSYEVLFLLSVRTEALSTDSPNLHDRCAHHMHFTVYFSRPKREKILDLESDGTHGRALIIGESAFSVFETKIDWRSLSACT